MISIVLTAYNQLEYTQVCLESILKYTPLPYKLRLIDNGSTDGTLDYFRITARNHIDTEIIHYDNNEIVEEIGNAAIMKETNPYIVGVTNDTIVHTGWLDNLIACLESASDIGMVGPRSNCISGVQQLYPGCYYNSEEYQAIAKGQAEKHKGEYFEVDRVVGMLTAMRLQAFRDAGGLDESLPTNGKDGGYGYSDDDLSTKMKKAGYRLLITNDVFIHHFGSVTVGAQALDAGLQKNTAKYIERFKNEG